MDKQKPAKATGIKRVINATKYSLQGLTYALKNETAFTQELTITILFIPLLIFIPCEVTFKVLVIMAHFSVMITELLNSAIEKVVDKVCPDYHILAKQAKDLASCAVFFAIVATVICWAFAIFNWLSLNFH